MSQPRRASAPEGGTAAARARILKKYPNRRLYDTQQSTYITLADVKTMVLAATTSRCATRRPARI